MPTRSKKYLYGICQKCKKEIKNKEFLKCSVCALIYDINCVTVTFRRFILMSNENKATWKCPTCRITKENINTSSSSVRSSRVSSEGLTETPVRDIHKQDNVTVRRLKTLSTSTYNESANLNPKAAVFETHVEFTSSESGVAEVREEHHMKSSDNTAQPSTDTNVEISNSAANKIDLRNESCLFGNSSQVLNEGSKVSFCSVNSFDILNSTPNEKELSSHSLPNLDSQVQNIVVEDLKEHVQKLKQQLLEADAEVQKLLSENYELQDALSETRKKCDIYRNLLKVEAGGSPFKTPANIASTTHLIKKRNKNRSAQKRITHSFHADRLGTSMSCDVLNANPPISNDDLATDQNLQLKTSSVKVASSNENSAHIMSTDNSNRHEKKLLLLSNNNKNKILPLLSGEYRLQEFEYCHHIVPGGGVKESLASLRRELKNFTKNDYCVILIGEYDFRSTRNYHALVNSIKTELEILTNTNIIIVCPTYVCGSPLYNARVETFNTLLNDDIALNGYAKYFDPNTVLCFDMFSERSGKVKNCGIKVILKNLQNYMLLDETKDSATFFRDSPDKF